MRKTLRLSALFVFNQRTVFSVKVHIKLLACFALKAQTTGYNNAKGILSIEG